VSTPGRSDSDRTILHMQREAVRRMTPEQRLRVVDELNASVETMAVAGIRVTHPAASDREIFLRLAIRKLGYDLARQVYPEIERLEGVRR
jgi:hypothetical protein